MKIKKLRSMSCRIAIVLAVVLASFGTKEPARAYTVRTEHPRIWLTPTVLAHLRAQAAANSPRWLALKHVCDSSSTPTWDVGIYNYALAYQISSDPSYADRAIALMQLSVNDGMRAITGDSGYQARNLLPGMAVGYDWCYPRLTPPQRTQFRTHSGVSFALMRVRLGPGFRSPSNPRVL